MATTKLRKPDVAKSINYSICHKKVSETLKKMKIIIFDGKRLSIFNDIAYLSNLAVTNKL